MEEEEKPWIKEAEKEYRAALDRFNKDRTISQHNKGLVLAFLRDAALGKTVIGRARKEIGPARLHGYIQHLKVLLRFTTKNLDELSQKDMEAFIEALRANRVQSRRRSWTGRSLVVHGGQLSSRYKIDVKVSVRHENGLRWQDNAAACRRAGTL